MPKRTITPARTAASRANGARSRGPITPQGKAVSARNSVRHGLLAQSTLISGEVPERFTDLLADFTARFLPQDPIEVELVETMALSRWGLKRVAAIHRATLEREIGARDSSEAADFRAAAAFKSLADNSKTLEVQHRYHTGYDRQFTRALRNLIKLRTENTILRNEPEMPLIPKDPAHTTPSLPAILTPDS